MAPLVDDAQLERLTPLVYEQLRSIAHRQLRRERADVTLSTTDLVHDGYVRLARGCGASPDDGEHVLGIASTVMRYVLIEYARRHHAGKRGNGQARVTRDDAVVVTDVVSEELLALNDALARLASLDERLARVVECRYFGGLTEVETARALGITSTTVRRDWVKAKGWLYRELADADR